MPAPKQMSLPFSINPPAGEGKRAILPSLGELFGGASGSDVLQSVSHYNAALHAMIGDTPNTPHESSNIVAAKALGIQVPQAYAFANFSFMPDANNWGLMQWPGINPESLRKICRENLAPQAVIAGRVCDLQRYSGLSSKPWEPGWRIVLRDPKATPSAKDRKDIIAAEKFIANCSRDYDDDPRERDAMLLSPFEFLLRQFADDIHTFDGWALWTQPDRLGRPIAFSNLPAGLIRLAMPGQGLKGDKRYFAAMIDQTNNPVKTFTRKELTWSVMYPRTDPATMSYGWPAPERAMRLVQAFQSAVDLNADAFQRNGLPNGMLLMKGDFFSQEQIDALMREWTNMKRGVSKLWGIPVMSVPEDSEVEVLDFMDMKGQDVRYRDHMNICMGLYCWISQFPIQRIGMFTSGMHRDNKPAPDQAVEIQGVDDPGLPAILSFIEGRINPYLLWPTWPNLKFVFENKDPKSDARSYEARKLAQTWGEARAEADLPKLETMVPPHLKAIAEIMSICPEDSSKAGVFQSVAAAVMESMFGGEEDGPGKDKKKSGAMFPSKIDPAKSQAHGHRAGVRRSANETEGAAA